MARAMKCDRCSKLYEHYDGAKQFKDTEEANGVHIVDKDSNEKFWVRKNYDLCPDCMEELEKFLNQH